jgi:hypothetical protein
MHKSALRRFLMACVVLLAALVGGHWSASAGTTGVLNGRVVYRHALSGPNAFILAPYIDVRLISETDVSYAKTDSNGYFSFVSVTPGLYDVLPGHYGGGCFPRAEIQADQMTSVRLVMYTMESVSLDCPFREVIIAPR